MRRLARELAAQVHPALMCWHAVGGSSWSFRRLLVWLTVPCSHHPVAQGAELIVALSHMRTPNDLVLAANVPEIQASAG